MRAERSRAASQWTPDEAAPKSTLGYAFDPVPSFLSDLIRERKLKPIDELVLKQLLRFKLLLDSCWTTKRVLGDAVGRTPRTIQSSLKRLTEAGVIAQVRVPVPDLDDPRNLTGWRFRFLWMLPAGRVVGSDVDRRPNEKRRRWVPVERAGELEISPPRPLQSRPFLLRRSQKFLPPRGGVFLPSRGAKFLPKKMKSS